MQFEDCIRTTNKYSIYCNFQVRSVTLPAEILRSNTLLTNLVIDDQVEVSHLQDGFLGDCDNVFVYMTDSTNPGILVYDARRDTAWRLSHPYMFPDPDFGTFSVRYL